MKKVNKSIRVIQSAYKKTAFNFYEYFESRLNESIDVNSTSSKMYKRATEYDKDEFHKFIDSCILYRLGIKDTTPSKLDIIYNLSNEVSPSFYDRTIDDVFEEMIYHALPVSVTQPFADMLSAKHLDPAAVELVMSKLTM